MSKRTSPPLHTNTPYVGFTHSVRSSVIPTQLSGMVPLMPVAAVSTCTWRLMSSLLQVGSRRHVPQDAGVAEAQAREGGKQSPRRHNSAHHRAFEGSHEHGLTTLAHQHASSTNPAHKPTCACW